MEREAKAIWEGNLKTGKGKLFTQSGVLKDTPYSFNSRFEDEKGTNPEELLAAAHAGCFSMALSNELIGSSLQPERIETQARISIQKIEGKWTIDRVHLAMKARVPGAQPASFFAAANRAKVNCPVSQLFNAQIDLDAQLEEDSQNQIRPDILIYTSTYCQVCGETKQLLEKHQISYQEIDLDQEPPERAEEIRNRTGRMSVPQIFVNNQFIGDYHDLLRLNESHGLDRLFKKKIDQPHSESKIA